MGKFLEKLKRNLQKRNGRRFGDSEVRQCPACGFFISMEDISWEYVL